LAGLGYHVLATGRNLAALEELKSEGERAGYSMDIAPLDVTSSVSRNQVFAWVERVTHGYGLDVLINNAGYGQMGPVELLTAEQLRDQFETNVISVMEISKLFIPAMRNRAQGRIINMSSIGGRVTFPFGGAYHASKYALEALTDAMRIELSPFGISVILIEPGAIRTSFAETGLRSVQALTSEGSIYSPLLAHAGTIQKQMDRHAASPRATSKALELAINARWPRHRYVTPWPNLLIIWLLKLLPGRLIDWCYKLVLGRALRS
jgi:short-subunit dehydrogenase